MGVRSPGLRVLSRPWRARGARWPSHCRALRLHLQSTPGEDRRGRAGVRRAPAPIRTAAPGRDPGRPHPLDRRGRPGVLHPAFAATSTAASWSTAATWPRRRPGSWRSLLEGAGQWAVVAGVVTDATGKPATNARVRGSPSSVVTTTSTAEKPAPSARQCSQASVEESMPYRSTRAATDRPTQKSRSSKASAPRLP